MVIMYRASKLVAVAAIILIVAQSSSAQDNVGDGKLNLLQSQHDSQQAGEAGIGKLVLSAATATNGMFVAADGRVYIGPAYPFSYALQVDGDESWGGIYVETDVGTGIHVGKAGDVYASGGFPGQKNGVEVYAAEDNGIMVNYADEEGMWIYDVKEHGVLVTSAMEDGIHVKCPGATSRPGSPAGWTPSESVCIGDALEAEYGYVNLATREGAPPDDHCNFVEDIGR